jgi:hypothetical protein
VTSISKEENVLSKISAQLCVNKKKKKKKKIGVRERIQKFPDWVDNEIHAYSNKHSLWSNIKGYGKKTH